MLRVPLAVAIVVIGLTQATLDTRACSPATPRALDANVVSESGGPSGGEINWRVQRRAWLSGGPCAEYAWITFRFGGADVRGARFSIVDGKLPRGLDFPRSFVSLRDGEVSWPWLDNGENFDVSIRIASIDERGRIGVPATIRVADSERARNLVLLFAALGILLLVTTFVAAVRRRRNQRPLRNPSRTLMSTDAIERRSDDDRDR